MVPVAAQRERGDTDELDILGLGECSIGGRRKPRMNRVAADGILREGDRANMLSVGPTWAFP